MARVFLLPETQIINESKHPDIRLLYILRIVHIHKRGTERDRGRLRRLRHVLLRRFVYRFNCTGKHLNAAL